MDERRDETGALEEGPPHTDMDEGGHIGFLGTLEDSAANLELHERHHAHDPAHVDLLQEEYTPEEAARLVGTSLEVVMHAIWGGELKAERKGHNVICIQRSNFADWLRRRAAE